MSDNALYDIEASICELKAVLALKADELVEAMNRIRSALTKNPDPHFETPENERRN